MIDNYFDMTNCNHIFEDYSPAGPNHIAIARCKFCGAYPPITPIATGLPFEIEAGYNSEFRIDPAQVVFIGHDLRSK